MIVSRTQLAPAPTAHGTLYARTVINVPGTAAGDQHLIEWNTLFDWGTFTARAILIRPVGDPLYHVRVTIGALEFAVSGNDYVLIDNPDPQVLIEVDQGRPLDVEIILSDAAQESTYFRRAVYSGRFARRDAVCWRGVTRANINRFETLGSGNLLSTNFLTIANFGAGSFGNPGAYGWRELGFTLLGPYTYITALHYRIAIIVRLADWLAGAGPFNHVALNVGKITTYTRAPWNLDQTYTGALLFDTAHVARDNPYLLNTFDAAKRFYIPVTMPAVNILPQVLAQQTATIRSRILLIVESLQEGELL